MTRKRRRTLVKIIRPTNLMHWKIKNEKAYVSLSLSRRRLVVKVGAGS